MEQFHFFSNFNKLLQKNSRAALRYSIFYEKTHDSANKRFKIMAPRVIRNFRGSKLRSAMQPQNVLALHRTFLELCFYYIIQLRLVQS